MVTTRSAGAPEPLEKLQTPPERTRKIKRPATPVPAIPAARARQRAGEGLRGKPYDTPMTLDSQSLTLENIAFAFDPEDLTVVAEDTPSKTTIPSSSVLTSTKRARDEVDHEPPSSKRARTQMTTTTSSDMLFMFPKKPSFNEDDDDIENAAPAKSYAEQIRRERRAREIAKRNNRLGITPRRQKPVRTVGDNPFGIQTFSEQEKAAIAAHQRSREVSVDRSQREERSAAPEPQPETPRRGLFGSLKTFGSAALGRLASPFSSHTPQASTPQSATAPHFRTEPRRKPVRVWDIQYPELESRDETPAPAATSDEETESDKKRKAFEARYGKPDKMYDHLHTIPADGDPESLPYPVKKVEEQLPRQNTLPPAAQAAYEKRKERRERLHGKRPAQEAPSTAPLFGPNSHYARGTKSPALLDFFTPGAHPAMRQPGEKRSFDDALADSTAPKEPSSKLFQPYSEDEPETAEREQEEPSTPAAKRQKTSNDFPKTPRSALKAPGSVDRTGRSARFNDNPIASIKKMSPIFGSSPAGEYPYSPNNLFNTFSDDAQHGTQQKDSPGSEPSPNNLFSPNTMTNTAINEGRRIHPGQALSEAIRVAGPIKEFKYVWRDPNNPDWKPSLGNPAPGTFRVPDFEDMDEESDIFEAHEESPAAELSAPEPPSTPRMSHAELPKQSSTPSSAAASASALEAANLERRRAEAQKTKPRTSSRLAEVTSARSRSPSPPGLDIDDAAEASDSSVKTPSPTLESASTAAPTWAWTDETREYLSSSNAYPDFAYNKHNELIPSFSLKTRSGSYDNTISGPDDMTERARQQFYTNRYDEAWAEKEFTFDAPQIYEEAGVGSKYIHELIRKNDARHPEVVVECDKRFAAEWDAHAKAIEDAVAAGKRLVATYPDRDGMEMQDIEED